MAGNPEVIGPDELPSGFKKTKGLSIRHGHCLVRGEQLESTAYDSQCFILWISKTGRKLPKDSQANAETILPMRLQKISYSGP